MITNISLKKLLLASALWFTWNDFAFAAANNTKAVATKATVTAPAITNSNTNTTPTTNNSNTVNNANTVSNVNKKDTDYPIEIQSDTAEFDDQKGIATYKGSVIATQGSRNLWADLLIIYRNKDNKIEKMIATGNRELAKIKSQSDPSKPVGYGKATTIKYYPEEDKAELIGMAELEQGGDIIKGDFLTYYFKQSLLLSNKVQNSRTTVILQPRNQVASARNKVISNSSNNQVITSESKASSKKSNKTGSNE